MDDKQQAIWFSGARVGIGALMFLFPGLVFGPLAKGRRNITPLVKLLGRLVGARDVVIGAGALVALQNGEPAGQWMAYGAAADGADAVAALLAYRHLPKRTRFGLVLAAAGGASTGLRLRSRVD